jgi:P4 family phage/plasmid primase-like protien
MSELKHILYEPDFFQKLDTKQLLCCKNGVVDFTTQTFRDGLKEDYCSKSTGIMYIENDCDLIEKDYSDLVDFLEQVFPFEDQRIFMFQHLASVLIGDCTNQQMFHYYGTGSNGKSMITSLMAKMLGEYAGTIPTTLICDKRGKIGSCSPEVAALKGLKYAVLQEPTKGDTINEGIMKELTGSDPISGRGLYQNTVTFYPTFTVVSALNHFFNINTTDFGTWRRQKVIKYYSSFLDTNGKDYQKDNELHFPLDKHIKDQFDRFKIPFLHFLVKTAFITKGNIQKCKMVETDTLNYRYDQDRIGKFILENVIEKEGSNTTKSQINSCANMWFEENYKYKTSNKEIYERLSIKYDCNKSGVYSGFDLKNCLPETKIVEPTKEQVFITEFRKYFEITDNKNDFIPSINISEWAKIHNLQVNSAKTINPLLLPLGLDVNNKDHYKKKKIEGKSIWCWFGVKLREIPLENVVIEINEDFINEEEEEEINVYE